MSCRFALIHAARRSATQNGHRSWEATRGHVKKKAPQAAHAAQRCHLDRSRRIPRSGSLSRSGEIPRMCPLPCRSEAFSQVPARYAFLARTRNSACTGPKSLASTLGRHDWYFRSRLFHSRPSRDSSRVEFPESASQRKPCRDLSTLPQAPAARDSSTAVEMAAPKRFIAARNDPYG
jgi:hypothetical protein